MPKTGPNDIYVGEGINQFKLATLVVVNGETVLIMKRKDKLVQITPQNLIKLIEQKKRIIGL